MLKHAILHLISETFFPRNWIWLAFKALATLTPLAAAAKTKTTTQCPYKWANLFILLLLLHASFSTSSSFPQLSRMKTNFAGLFICFIFCHGLIFSLGILLLLPPHFLPSLRRPKTTAAAATTSAAASTLLPPRRFLRVLSRRRRRNGQVFQEGRRRRWGAEAEKSLPVSQERLGRVSGWLGSSSRPAVWTPPLRPFFDRRPSAVINVSRSAVCCSNNNLLRLKSNLYPMYYSLKIRFKQRVRGNTYIFARLD